MAAMIAHKREDGTEQTVKEHLKGTAEMAQQFASAFDAAGQGALVGWAHDIGKYSSSFQKRILEGGPRTDHSTAGAYECALRGQVPAAFCVAGHHGGLPDLGSLDDRTEATLRARLNRAAANQIPDYSPWRDEVALPDAVLSASFVHDSLSSMFFTRMLYSCLVDADYLDTERFMNGPSGVRGPRTTMAMLEERLENHIRGWFPPKGELNEKRCAILDNCIRQGRRDQGFFTLTVPTGGGKTVASLAFALKHAIAHGLERIIYVVPYTSIIEQTAEVFRGILGSENVLEHHSGVEFDAEERISEEYLRKSLATENWDMPVIVTTAVQFYESLFACKSSKCRKLHNIAKSVVIFDEAQMLPVPVLRPCVYAMAQLVMHYHVTGVLCTATQPVLEGVFREFTPDYAPTELCPPELAKDPVFRRTRIVPCGTLSWSDVADRMNRESQILCIVNSRKHAQDVYARLEGEGCYHLSTLMIPAERKRILAEIRERLDQNQPCRVVSTSLIEAGVDVDFPAVMREEAGVDSIIQAAGRCNREGRRDPEESIVTVFQPETPAPKLFAMSIAASREALRQCGDFASADTITRYFRELLFLKGKDALDQFGIIRQASGQTFPFRSIAEQFHIIGQDTFTVYIPLNEGAELLDRRLGGEINRPLMRKLTQYSVNIYPQHLQALRESGDIQLADKDLWYLNNLSLYDKETGLSLTPDYGKGEFI